MKRILLTGSTGFIGRNIKPILCENYDVVAPNRTELDLLNADAVRRFLEYGKFDAVVHLANPTAINPIDKYDDIFELSLRVFTSLIHCSGLFGRLIYLGSGAEYGKHRAITQFDENEFGYELPRDPYGLSRYIMNELASRYNNIFNLRVFGCYGCGDPPFKLIPHIMKCVREEKTIELRQNTVFDFLYVKDIAPVLDYFIRNELKHKSYNLCSGVPILTGDIAKEVRRQMKSSIPIVFQQNGFGLEYTGNNSRLCSEMPNWKPRLLIDGIKEIIEYENRET